MKKTIAFVVILISLSCCGCRKCGSPDNPTDSRVSSCFFKVGSYFIYNDTTDHIIDSQYVFLYSYQPNFFPSVSDGCTSYTNSYNMQMISYRNGLLYDTISSLCDASPGYVAWSHGAGSSASAYYPGMDSSFNNFVVDGHVYPTVYLTGDVIYGVTPASNIQVDYYFAPGYGVVKRVEHRTTGDVSWDLIRYHITSWWQISNKAIASKK